jgi:hypothetical protein
MSRPSLVDRAALLKHLQAAGPQTSRQLWAAVGDPQRKARQFRCTLYRLRDMGLLSSKKDELSGELIWVFEPALLHALPKPAPKTKAEPVPAVAAPKARELVGDEDDEGQCFYPRYCLERVAPPRQMDLRHTTYKPAPWAPPRG